MKIRISVNDIIFEDDNYLAVNKKAGWPVHQTLDPNRPNLLNSLKSYIKQRDKLTETPYLAIHHRLDLDTTGVIIFGKTNAANPILSDLFTNRKAVKIYEAICIGSPTEKTGTIENFLKKEKINKIEVITPTTSGGKKAITKFELLDTKDNLALIKFELITGRMHQIRSHCQSAGFPILGDDCYGNTRENSKVNIHKHLLHSKELSFFDPLSNKEIIITAKAPFSLDVPIQQQISKDQYIIFNKPYNVLCQFTKQTNEEVALCDFNMPEEIYPAGRLDKDSEGLLLLTNDGDINKRLSSPDYFKEKKYLVQVEGIPKEESIKKLKAGVTIKGGYKTRPCDVVILEDFTMPDRIPPIRERKSIPTSWLEIIITEGKNRQVRKMTAQVGHPTLRLIRLEIGSIKLPNDLSPGEFRNIKKEDIKL